MEKIEVKKKDLLLNAKYEIERMLSGLMPIKFVKSELYIVDKFLYSKLLEIDAVLAPNKKGTKKTNIYSINAKIGVTWTLVSEILGHQNHFYLDTKIGSHLDTFLVTPMKKINLS